MENVPNKVAVNYIKGRVAMSPSAFGKLPDALRSRAFTAAGIEDINTLQQIQDAIAQLPAGGDWNQLRSKIAQQMQMDEKEARGRAELLLRVNGMQAYAAARYADQQSTIDDFPYLMYKSAKDGRERDSHRALDGLVLRADDPFWNTHYPPWEWGCRCYVIKLTNAQAERQGIDNPKRVSAPPSDDYRFDPKGLTVNIEKTFRELSPEVEAFARKLFGQTEIEYDDGKTKTLLDANKRS